MIFNYKGPRSLGARGCRSATQESLRTTVLYDSLYIVRFSMFEFELSPDFCGEYENYTFLESLWYRLSEKQCFHLPRVQYGRHLAFYKMASMKQVLVNISARY